MKIFGKELTFNGKRVYHENDKPTPAEIGAAKSDHSHDTVNKAHYLIDSNNSNNISAAYSKAGLKYSEYNWLAAWNGYELRAVNKSHFAPNANMTGASASAAGKAGLVPAPAAGAATRYLRSDGKWTVPPDTNTTYTNFVKSGSGAKAGLVPAPSTTAGTTKYLREDGTWTAPPDTKYTHPTTSGNKHIPSGGKSGQILGWSADGTAKWQDPSTSGTQVITQSTQPSGHVSGRVWVKTY